MRLPTAMAGEAADTSVKAFGSSSGAMATIASAAESSSSFAARRQPRVAVVAPRASRTRNWVVGLDEIGIEAVGDGARNYAKMLAARSAKQPGELIWPITQPVGAENPVTSCDLHVFVDEAAESVSSKDADGRAGTWRAACGRSLIQ